MPRKTLIKHRRDTKANWASINPILADGEPGVETDTNRTKIGNGMSTWGQLGYQSVPFYGAFQDDTTQTIASTTTAYAMKLGTTDFSNGVTVVSNGSGLTRVTFAHAGLYNLQWSGQFMNTSNSDQDMAVWLRKNGTDIPGSTGHVTVPGKHGSVNGAIISAWNYFVSVTAGQYIEFMWHADSTGVTLQYYPAGTAPTTPTTASVIVTVQQVA
jgi:hypothetical protein